MIQAMKNTFVMSLLGLLTSLLPAGFAIEELLAVRSDMITVLIGGSSVEMNDWIDEVDSLIWQYYAGMEIALSWHYTKGVAAPIVGATKVLHLDTAVKAANFELTEADVKYLEEVYKPHRIVGALAE